MRLTHAVIFGGVHEYPKIRTLRRGVDVLVAKRSVRPDSGRDLDVVKQLDALLHREVQDVGDISPPALETPPAGPDKP